MKRIVSLMLCFLFVLCLASCKSKNKKTVDENKSSSVVVEEDNQKTFDIKTEVTTLKYPERWEKTADIKTEEDKVVFSLNDKTVFEIVFKECDGYLLGTYNGTPIYIVETETEDYNEKLMLEDVDIILQNLLEDENFKVATNSGEN
ncbi:MAG: hypothetical protein IJJ40_04965 [Clostridia bacterium]|nr:hypothetical protein [Clostridia bacterium]